MARPLPLEFAGAIYHLTSCVNARQKVFFSDADRVPPGFATPTHSIVSCRRPSN